MDRQNVSVDLQSMSVRDCDRWLAAIGVRLLFSDLIPGFSMFFVPAPGGAGLY